MDLKRHALQGKVDNLDGGRVATPVDWSLPACITDNSQVLPLDGWPNREFRVLSPERNAPRATKKEAHQVEGKKGGLLGRGLRGHAIGGVCVGGDKGDHRRNVGWWQGGARGPTRTAQGAAPPRGVRSTQSQWCLVRAHTHRAWLRSSNQTGRVHFHRLPMHTQAKGRGRPHARPPCPAPLSAVVEDVHREQLRRGWPRLHEGNGHLIADTCVHQGGGGRQR